MNIETVHEHRSVGFEGEDPALALAHGATLDDAELLYILLSQHMDRTDAHTAASHLLTRFGTLSGVLGCDTQTLMKIDGISQSAALGIAHVNQLLKAVSRAKISDCALLDCDRKIIDYCCAILRKLDHEQFHALFLNRRGELLHHACLQKGTIDHVTVYPRELLRRAIHHKASFVILAHNHPVGKAQPSAGDISMTRELSKLCKAIGAIVFDHVIISQNDCFSFRRNGLLAAAGVDTAFPFAALRPK